jgi:hypothetical protein
MLIRIGSNGFLARRDSPSESLNETARMFNQINGQIIVFSEDFWQHRGIAKNLECNMHSRLYGFEPRLVRRR